MTLAKVIERLLGQQNSGGSLLRDCFHSLMEALIRSKDIKEETEVDEEDSGESEDNDEDDYSNDDNEVGISNCFYGFIF